jgi:hypothetical protein
MEGSDKKKTTTGTDGRMEYRTGFVIYFFYCVGWSWLDMSVSLSLSLDRQSRYRKSDAMRYQSRPTQWVWDGRSMRKRRSAGVK